MRENVGRIAALGVWATLAGLVAVLIEPNPLTWTVVVVGVVCDLIVAGVAVEEIRQARK
jgi:hypothetical protein